MRSMTPLLACLTLATPALVFTTDAEAQMRRSIDPRRAIAEAMLKPMTVSFTDARLADVMTFLQDFTGAAFDVMWIDDRHADGLDPEQTVSLSVRDMPALNVLERVLKRAGGGFEAATWQFSEEGELQIGPKSRLNQFATLRLYDIRDLLFRVDSFTETPDLDLGQIIQGQGGGAAGGDFEFEDRPRGAPEEEAQEIIDLIIRFVEPDQWRDNGGDGGSITFYQGSLLVRAPDYMHRQLVGYSFWPTNSGARDARRAVRDRSTFQERVEDNAPPAVAEEKPDSHQRD